MSRKTRLTELGIKAYEEGGLIEAIATIIDEATKPKRIPKSEVKTARDVVALLTKHCSEHFVFRNPTLSKLKLLEAELNDVTFDDLLHLCAYYIGEKDFSWANHKMGINYLIKNISTDLGLALDYTPEEGPKIR